MFLLIIYSLPADYRITSILFKTFLKKLILYLNKLNITLIFIILSLLLVEGFTLYREPFTEIDVTDKPSLIIRIRPD